MSLVQWILNSNGPRPSLQGVRNRFGQYLVFTKYFRDKNENKTETQLVNLPIELAPKRRVALITGITGQDGSYLAELLLEKGYEVHGIIRRSSLINTHRIDGIYHRITLHYGDLTDSTNLVRVIQLVKPDEIYNLGAQSHVKVSFEMPEYTADVEIGRASCRERV
mgnify:CR=1 FL=1